MFSPNAEIRGLGDRVEDPEGCVGFGVYDPLGQKIGAVEELFVNDGGEPQYVKTRMGFLGLKRVLIPVESVAVERQRRAIVLR